MTTDALQEKLNLDKKENAICKTCAFFMPLQNVCYKIPFGEGRMKPTDYCMLHEKIANIYE